MLILNMFIYKSFYEQKKISWYHCCSNVWNNENSNASSIKLLDILVLKNYRCVDVLDKVSKR
jgi:hypothetical protein